MTDDTDGAVDAAENTEASSKTEPGPAAAWALDPEEAPTPEFSVVADDILVAFVWSGETGELRRTGIHATEDPVALSFGDVLVFDAARATTLQEFATKAAELDNFRFSVELEGWSWVEGVVQPHARLRRF